MAKCMLTERITFQELIETTTNENGFEVEEWKDIYSCWANKRTISGKEFLQLGGDKTKIITSFTVRYCKKIKDISETYETKTIRILHRNIVYDIQYPYNVKNENNFIDFKCQVVR